MSRSVGRSRPTGAMARHGPIGWLLLSGVSLGVSTALTKISLEQLTPVDLFGIEIAVSALPLGVLAARRGARLRRPEPSLLLLGVLEPGLAYLLFDLGIRRTAASHAALLLSLDAPMTLAMAVAFLRERLHPALMSSLALGVAGSILITWRRDGAGTSVIGDLLVIAATVSAAAFTVLDRHLAPSRDPVVLTAVQMIGASLVAAPVFGASLAAGDSTLSTADGRHLVLAVATGLLGGVIPFLLFNRAITRISASRASLVLLLVPVIGAAASVLLVHERVTGLAVLGGALTIAGAAVAARRDDSPADGPTPPSAGDGDVTVTAPAPLSPTSC